MSKKKEISDVVLEEDPNTRYLTKKGLSKDECLYRKDQIDSWYMKIKIVLFWMLLIIPFRMFHVFFWLILYCLWYQVFVRVFSKVPILDGCSKILDFYARRYCVPLFSWWMQIQYGFYYPTLVKVEKDVFEKVCRKYQGEPGKPENRKPYICISNHSGYCDTFVMFKQFGERGVVAKMGLKHDLILGPLMRELGCIFTDRKNIGRKIISKTNKYYEEPGRIKRLMMFPEGTTTNGKFLLKFHTGAFLPGKPLDIGFIRYKYKYFDPSWANCSSAIQYFETLNSQFYQDYVFLKFPVYNPNEAEKKDPNLFARNVRLMMCDIANHYTAEKIGEVKLSNIKFVRHLKKK